MTERLYYADAFCTNFEAVVTDIQELSRADGKSIWGVALDRSAFYPTSGGQPYDTGRLIATAPSGTELAAEIVNVEEDEASGIVWHHTAKPLSARTPVRGVVNQVRRFDHMQQHSGQHLLSAAFIHVCGAATVSFHLGNTTSTIDLSADRLSEDVLGHVAELANRIIAEDRPVHVETISRSEAEAMFAAGELRKLPSRAGDLRIIEIAGFDRNACGGTHVRSTGQIGGLHLRSTEKVKQGIRVEFVSGLRAMSAAREDFVTLTNAARQLSVNLSETPDAIGRLLINAKATSKQTEALTGELLRYRAQELIRDTPLLGGMRWVQLQLLPPEVPDSGQAKLLASKLVAEGEKTVALVSWRPRVSEDAPATLILARSRDLGLNCGAVLKEILTKFGGRGGGSPDLAQGSADSEHLEPALEAIRLKLRALAEPRI